MLECRRHTAGLVTDVLADLSSALRRRMTKLAGRVVGVGISVPASVRDGRAVDAFHLGWHDVDLISLLRLDGDPLVRLGDDATLAALAEARRGALRRRRPRPSPARLARRRRSTRPGRTAADRRLAALAGEFGHLPLAGDPRRGCACGSRGCWDLDVGANALIGTSATTSSVDRRLDHAERLIAQAAGGDPASGRAVDSARPGPRPGHRRPRQRARPRDRDPVRPGGRSSAARPGGP